MSYSARSDSFEYLCYGSTTDINMTDINMLILTAWGSTLDVNRRQILMTKVGPGAVRVNDCFHLTHHNDQCVDHTNGSNECQHTNKFERVLWEFEIYWFWKHNWTHQLTFGSWEAWKINLWYCWLCWLGWHPPFDRCLTLIKMKHLCISHGDQRVIFNLK